MGQFFNETEQDQSSIGDNLNEYMKTAGLKRASFLLIIIFSVGILIFIAAITEIPITRSATGIISSGNGATSIYSNKEVRRVYAHVGQNLEKGETVLEYADGSFEWMPVDGILLEANRTREAAGSDGKVISYLTEEGSKTIYFFLPTEQALGIEGGQEVHLSHRSGGVASDNDNVYTGKVSYINDNFFDIQEIQDFVGSANMTHLLIRDSLDSQMLYRLIGVDSPEYISRFTLDTGSSYGGYLNSICNITVTINKVSVLKYLFSY